MARARQHFYLGISDSHSRMLLEPASATLLLFMFPVRGGSAGQNITLLINLDSVVFSKNNPGSCPAILLIK